MTEIKKVDAKALGLDEDKAKQIENQFAPATIEQVALTTVYESLLTEEMSPELVKRANVLNKQLRVVRQNIEKIRKTEKRFYLSGGEFVDAWAKMSSTPIVIMENKTKEFANYYVNLKKKEVKRLGDERASILELYGILHVGPETVGAMKAEAWDSYILGIKTTYDTNKENARLIEVLKAKDLKAAEDEAARDAKIKADALIENAKLKALADKREADALALAEAEKIKSDAAIKLIEDAKNAEIKALKDAQDIKDLEAKKAQDIKDAETKRLADIETAKQKVIQDAKDEEIRLAKVVTDKIALELKQKNDADVAEALRVAELAQKELAKGDALKMVDLVNDLLLLKTKYVFKSEKHKKLYSEIGGLIDKITAWVQLKK